MKTWMLFALGAALCWGMYGPTLHVGQSAMGNSSLRAFLWVGIAYFLIAVLVPGAMLISGAQSGAGMQFTAKGSMMAGLAGALGAIGALCIIYAMINKGIPSNVMPMVFGGAPLVNVGLSMLLHRPEKAPSPMLWLGYAMAIIGVTLVLKFNPAAKPGGAHPPKTPAAATAPAAASPGAPSGEAH